MFFLSLMLFAWLVFDWHAAVPMMIAMCFAAYGAPRPWRADSAPEAKCPRPPRAQHLQGPCADAPPLSRTQTCTTTRCD